MGKGVGNTGPWGERPPRKPTVGAGRAALARRAKARGGAERKSSPEAARRGLGRGRRGVTRRKPGRVSGGRARRAIGDPMRGAAAELGRWGRVFEQKFLLRQRLRTLLIALAAAWVVWTFLVGDASLPRLWWVQRQNAQLDARIEDLSREKQTLEIEVQSLEGRSATDGVERVAREEHALVRDGEVLVRFREVPVGKAPSDASSEESGGNE